MKILLITWNYPPKIGGIEELLSQFVHHISESIDIQILGPYQELKTEKNKTAIIVRPKRDGLLNFFLFALIKGIRLNLITDYYGILGGSVLITPIVMILSKLFHKKSYVFAYGLDLIYPSFFYQIMVKFLLPKIDRVFTISQASCNEVEKKGCLPEHISIIHPGVNYQEFRDLPNLSNIRRKYGLYNCKILLYVGRLARRKGLVEFIKYSLREIVSKHPEVIFIIIGGNPELSLTHKSDIASEIQAVSIRLEIKQHVRLLGWIDRKELIDLYHSSDIFILPAIHVPGDIEGFGIVLLEAAAAGKPIVSTKIGGIIDAIQDGQSGFLVPEGEWDTFTDKILRLLGDDSLRDEMGEFGRNRVKKQFDWSIIVGKFREQICDETDGF